jgi:hypothetical protein
MIVVVALLVLWASYRLANYLHAKVEGAERGQSVATPVSSTETLGVVGSAVAWSALDDHQLTRLLMQSASTTTTDGNDGTDH